MTFVKFDPVRGNLLEQVDGLFIALVFSFGQTHQQLKITRLGNQLVLPLGIREIFELLWLFSFLDKVGVSSRDVKLGVGGNPIGFFQECRVARRFRE
jgi:hypothetical protein